MDTKVDISDLITPMIVEANKEHNSGNSNVVKEELTMVNEGIVKSIEGENFLQSPSFIDGEVERNTEDTQVNSKSKTNGSQNGDKIDMKIGENNSKPVSEPIDFSQGTTFDIEKVSEKRDDKLNAKAIASQQDSTETSFKEEDDSQNKSSELPLIKKVDNIEIPKQELDHKAKDIVEDNLNDKSEALGNVEMLVTEAYEEIETTPHSETLDQNSAKEDVTTISGDINVLETLEEKNHAAIDMDEENGKTEVALTDKSGNDSNAAFPLVKEGHITSEKLNQVPIVETEGQVFEVSEGFESEQKGKSSNEVIQIAKHFEKNADDQIDKEEEIEAEDKEHNSGNSEIVTEELIEVNEGTVKSIEGEIFLQSPSFIDGEVERNTEDSRLNSVKELNGSQNGNQIEMKTDENHSKPVSDVSDVCPLEEKRDDTINPEAILSQQDSTETSFKEKDDSENKSSESHLTEKVGNIEISKQELGHEAKDIVEDNLNDEPKALASVEMLVLESSEEIETTPLRETPDQNSSKEDLTTISNDINVLATPEEKNLAAIELDEKNKEAEIAVTDESGDDTKSTSPLVVDEEEQIISEKLNQVSIVETEGQGFKVSECSKGEHEDNLKYQTTKHFDKNTNDQIIKEKDFEEPKERAKIEEDINKETLTVPEIECDSEDVTSGIQENITVANIDDKEEPEEPSMLEEPENKIENDTEKSENVSSLASQAVKEEVYEAKTEETKNYVEKADTTPERILETTNLTDVESFDKPLEETSILKAHLSEHEIESKNLERAEKVNAQLESHVQAVQDVYEITRSPNVEEIGANEIEKIIREVPEELSEADENSENGESETKTQVEDKIGLEGSDAVLESKDQNIEEIHETKTRVGAEKKEEVSENNKAETSKPTRKSDFHDIEETKEIQTSISGQISTKEEKEELNTVPETGNSVDEIENETTAKTETELVNPDADEDKEEKLSESTLEPNVQCVEGNDEVEPIQTEEAKDVLEHTVQNIEEVEKLNQEAPEAFFKPANQVVEAVKNEKNIETTGKADCRQQDEGIEKTILEDASTSVSDYAHEDVKKECESAEIDEEIGDARTPVTIYGYKDQVVENNAHETDLSSSVDESNINDIAKVEKDVTGELPEAINEDIPDHDIIKLDAEYVQEAKAYVPVIESKAISVEQMHETRTENKNDTQINEDTANLSEIGTTGNVEQRELEISSSYVTVQDSQNEAMEKEIDEESIDEKTKCDKGESKLINDQINAFGTSSETTIAETIKIVDTITEDSKVDSTKIQETSNVESQLLSRDFETESCEKTTAKNSKDQNVEEIDETDASPSLRDTETSEIYNKVREAPQVIHQVYEADRSDEIFLGQKIQAEKREPISEPTNQVEEVSNGDFVSPKVETELTSSKEFQMDGAQENDTNSSTVYTENVETTEKADIIQQDEGIVKIVHENASTSVSDDVQEDEEKYIDEEVIIPEHKDQVDEDARETDLSPAVNESNINEILKVEKEVPEELPEAVNEDVEADGKFTLDREIAETMPNSEITKKYEMGQGNKETEISESIIEPSVIGLEEICETKPTSNAGETHENEEKQEVTNKIETGDNDAEAEEVQEEKYSEPIIQRKAISVEETDELDPTPAVGNMPRNVEEIVNEDISPNQTIPIMSKKELTEPCSVSDKDQYHETVTEVEILKPESIDTDDTWLNEDTDSLETGTRETVVQREIEISNSDVTVQDTQNGKPENVIDKENIEEKMKRDEGDPTTGNEVTLVGESELTNEPINAFCTSSETNTPGTIETFDISAVDESSTVDSQLLAHENETKVCESFTAETDAENVKAENSELPNVEIHETETCTGEVAKAVREVPEVINQVYEADNGDKISHDRKIQAENTVDPDRVSSLAFLPSEEIHDSKAITLENTEDGHLKKDDTEENNLKPQKVTGVDAVKFEETLDVETIIDDEVNEKPLSIGELEEIRQESSSALFSGKQDETEESKISETKTETNVVGVQEVYENETNTLVEETYTDKVAEETKDALEKIPDLKCQDIGVITDPLSVFPTEIIESKKDEVEDTYIAPTPASEVKSIEEIEPNDEATKDFNISSESKALETMEVESIKPEEASIVELSRAYENEEAHESVTAENTDAYNVENIESVTTTTENTENEGEKVTQEVLISLPEGINQDPEAISNDQIPPSCTSQAENVKVEVSNSSSVFLSGGEIHETCTKDTEDDSLKLQENQLQTIETKEELNVDEVEAEAEEAKSSDAVYESKDHLDDIHETKSSPSVEISDDISNVEAIVDDIPADESSLNQVYDDEVNEKTVSIEELEKRQESSSALLSEKQDEIEESKMSETKTETTVVGVQEVYENETTTFVEETHTDKVAEETKDALEKISDLKYQDIGVITYPVSVKILDTDIAPPSASEVKSIEEIEPNDEATKDFNISSESKAPETIEVESIKPEEASIVELTRAIHENKEAHESVTAENTDAYDVEVENQKILAAESEYLSVEEIHGANANPIVGETDIDESEKVVREVPKALPEGNNQVPEADRSDEITIEEEVLESSPVFLSSEETQENVTTIENTEDEHEKVTQEVLRALPESINQDPEAVSNDQFTPNCTSQAENIEVEVSNSSSVFLSGEEAQEDEREKVTQEVLRALPEGINQDPEAVRNDQITPSCTSQAENVEEEVSNSSSVFLSGQKSHETCTKNTEDDGLKLQENQLQIIQPKEELNVDEVEVEAEAEEAKGSDTVYESKDDIHETKPNPSVEISDDISNVEAIVDDIPADESISVSNFLTKNLDTGANITNSADDKPEEVIISELLPESGVLSVEEIQIKTSPSVAMTQDKDEDETKTVLETTFQPDHEDAAEIIARYIIFNQTFPDENKEDIRKGVEEADTLPAAVVEEASIGKINPIDEVVKTSFLDTETHETIQTYDSTEINKSQLQEHETEKIAHENVVQNVQEIQNTSAIGSVNSYENEETKSCISTTEPKEQAVEDIYVVVSADMNESDQETRESLEKSTKPMNQDAGEVGKEEDSAIQYTEAKDIEDKGFVFVPESKDQIFEETCNTKTITAAETPKIVKVEDGKTQEPGTVPGTVTKPNNQGFGENISKETNPKNTVQNESKSQQIEPCLALLKNQDQETIVEDRVIKAENATDSFEAGTEVEESSSKPVGENKEAFDLEFEEIENPLHTDSENIHVSELTEEPEKAETSNTLGEPITSDNSTVETPEQISVGTTTANAVYAEKEKNEKYAEIEGKDYENLATESTRSIEEVKSNQVTFGTPEDELGDYNEKDVTAITNINNFENCVEKEKFENESHVPILEKTETKGSVGTREQKPTNIADFPSSKTTTDEELAIKDGIFVDEKQRGFILDPTSIISSTEEKVEKLVMLPTTNSQEALGDVTEPNKVTKESQEEEKISLSLSQSQIARKEYLNEEKENKNAIASKDFQVIQEAKHEEIPESVEKLTQNDTAKVSLSEILQKSTNQTKQITEESKIKLQEKGLVEEEKTDEEEENEQKRADSGSDAPVMVEASRDIDVKTPHKKSHNILSGVGSKVKQSISKVKKAITGKSSNQKTSSPKEDKKNRNSLLTIES